MSVGRHNTLSEEEEEEEEEEGLFKEEEEEEFIRIHAWLAPCPPGLHQRLVFYYTSQCSAVALGERMCVLFIGPLSVTLTRAPRVVLPDGALCLPTVCHLL